MNESQTGESISNDAVPDPSTSTNHIINIPSQPYTKS